MLPAGIPEPCRVLIQCVTTENGLIHFHLPFPKLPFTFSKVLNFGKGLDNTKLQILNSYVHLKLYQYEFLGLSS